MNHAHARQIEITGRVQGVGFRPFVARLAQALGLSGWVLNTGQGVKIHAQGEQSQLQAFQARLMSEAPPASVILTVTSVEASAGSFEGFSIIESQPLGQTQDLHLCRLVIAPDLTICPTCLVETTEPANRRFGYALNSCTDCGPRFTLQSAAPFDRPRTTMADFTLCGECAGEYRNPNDRRFHAQNIGCPQCGPRLWLETAHGQVLVEPDAAPNHNQALNQAAEILRSGRLLAAKGVGGFHLLCDATSHAAVQQLRLRKKRDRKPFAVLFRDRTQLSSHVECSDQDWDLLRGPVTPILLLDRLPESTLAAEVAPGLPSVGAMLPCNALQAGLLARLHIPLIATSANLSNEPIPIENEVARRDLSEIADAFLIHNRRILRPADDTVIRRIRSVAVAVRIGRGLAPLRLEVGRELPPMLAAGGHQKAALAVSRGRELFLSPQIGDLDTPSAYRRYQEQATDLCHLLSVTPQAIIHDLHPDYASTRYAKQRGLPAVAIQHHQAHVLACMAEHGETGPALGVALDGTGFGPDGTTWGGEFLAVERGQWQRVGSLWPFSLVGGDRAAREPRFAALAVCAEAAAPWPANDGFRESERAFLRQALASTSLAQQTTSAGRLFDAWAALLDVCQVSTYESEAAMRLEAQAETVQHTVRPLPVHVVVTHGLLRLDWRPWVHETQQAVAAGVSPAQLSARFHEGLAAGIVQIAQQVGTHTVVLSGGCFLNRRLSERTFDLLQAKGFRVLTHRQIPPGDGGLAIGQLWAAAMRPSG